MEDLNRRALMGAATVVGLAALASRSKAGPVDPPSGPVGPTNHTLDEIYNKIGADGRTPIPGGASTTVISTPGSYVLTGNITLSTNVTAISVSASNVTVDLNGFTISNSAIGAPLINVAVSLHNITIRNGSLVGGSNGVTSTGVSQSLFEDLNILNPRYTGLTLGSTVDRSIVVRRCSIIGPGSTGLSSDVSTVAGIILSGKSHRVLDCFISELVAFGTGGKIGVYFNTTSAGHIVSGCAISNDFAITATGINFTTSGLYRDNTVVNFSTKYFNGTDGTGNV